MPRKFYKGELPWLYGNDDVEHIRKGLVEFGGHFMKLTIWMR